MKRNRHTLPILLATLAMTGLTSLSAAPGNNKDYNCRFILVSDAFMPRVDLIPAAVVEGDQEHPAPKTEPKAANDKAPEKAQTIDSALQIPSNVVLVDNGTDKPARIALVKKAPSPVIALPKGKPISLYRESIAKQGGTVEKRNAGKTAPEVSSANWTRVICLLQSQDNGATFALTPFDLGPAKESKTPTVTVANLGSRDYFVRATPTATWECCKPGTPVTLALPEGTKDCDIPIGTPRTRRGKTTMSKTSSAYINFVEKEARTVILLLETVPGSPDVITVPGDFTPAKP